MKDIYGFFGFQTVYDKVFPLLEDGDNIIEIGSFLGKSTSHLASLIKNSGKKINFYVIDPWKRETCSPSTSIQCKVPQNMFPKFKENLEVQGLYNYVIPIQSTSYDAYSCLSHLQFKFIFIDGSHQFQDVVNDIYLYKKLLGPGGVLAGDDYQILDVVKAVKQELGASYFTINGNGNIMWVYKNDASIQVWNK